MAGKVTVIGAGKYSGIGIKGCILFDDVYAATIFSDETIEIPVRKKCVMTLCDFVQPHNGCVEIEDGMHTIVELKRNSLTNRISMKVTEKTPFSGVFQTPITPLDAIVEKIQEDGYCVKEINGPYMRVYEDKVIITRKSYSSAVGKILAADEKTIYYIDVLGVQFKKSSKIIPGYLQFETASSTEKDSQENSFAFTLGSNMEMELVAQYVKSRVDEIKKQKNAPVVMASPVSAADELKKFKELLDLGIITQEEFDAKKKQLLGL